MTLEQLVQQWRDRAAALTDESLPWRRRAYDRDEAEAFTKCAAQLESWLRDPAAQPEDWTAENGFSNSSPLFHEMVMHVERLIRNGAHALIAGNAEHVARMIVAQLAHNHGFAPQAAISSQLPASKEAP